jgi:GNAT superfamily N-acetyltransferase
LYLYETYSFEDDAPVDVIEVRTGEDQRIGWAILFHEQDRVSVLKELFVWPTWRRHGIGTLLEKAAVSEARKWHALTIKLYFHTADARPGPRIAGRTFGPSAGYEWHWRRSYYPDLAAIGVKAV